MMTLPTARRVLRAGGWSGRAGRCALDYEQRFLRRRKLIADDGSAFVVDLGQATSLNHGDALEVEDGSLIEIVAAPEALLIIEGKNLTRLAWHIGNRHTPCQIEDGRLLIRDDPVIADMLNRLGARVAHVTEPFTPEGGAYGHGRTFAHDHGHGAHGH